MVGQPLTDGDDGQLMIVELRLHDPHDGGHRPVSLRHLPTHTGQGMEQNQIAELFSKNLAGEVTA